MIFHVLGIDETLQSADFSGQPQCLLLAGARAMAEFI